METVWITAHTDHEGRLLLEVPTSLEDSEVEVMLTVHQQDNVQRDPLGWQVGFWRQFAGSIPDFPEMQDAQAEQVDQLL